MKTSYSITAICAASLGLCPVWSTRVYPPCLCLYLSAISVKSLCITSSPRTISAAFRLACKLFCKHLRAQSALSLMMTVHVRINTADHHLFCNGHDFVCKTLELLCFGNRCLNSFIPQQLGYHSPKNNSTHHVRLCFPQMMMQNVLQHLTSALTFCVLSFCPTCAWLFDASY